MRNLNLILVIAAIAAPAGAPADEWDEEAEEPYTAETWPVELVRRPLTPAAGMWEIDALVNVNLTKGEIGKPISLAPGIFRGITDRVALGIAHIRGLCVSGAENNCPYIYNDMGVLLRWAALRQGPWEIVLRGGFQAEFQPAFRADAVVRVTARWRMGRFALAAEPFANVALTDREDSPLTGPGNSTFIGVSGRPEAQITRRVAAYGLVKLFGAVNDWERTYFIYSGLGALVGLGRFDVGAQVVFSALLGPNERASEGLGKFDQREVQIFGAARF